MFQDRADAGRQLAAKLQHLKHDDPIVFGLPRGGVVVAAQVASALQAPLEVLVVRKLGAPGHAELAIGAVTGGESPMQTLNHDLIDAISVSDAYLEEEIIRQLREVRRGDTMYRKGRPEAPVEGRTAIIIDDGIATGATVQAGIMGVREKRPQKIVLAVPVAPPDSLNRLAADVDEVVCLLAPPDFMAVGVYYTSFTQTTDDEVVRFLDQFQNTGIKK